ncbi:MAG: hypothetical protein HYT98_00250 [Candidatus Sungbacteria bacterium]|nr:hypothetical protein [Candidatus Sungbacteria bacterium]
MKKYLKKYFIPHAENKFRPHIFGEPSVFMLAVIIVMLFFLPFLFRTGDFYALILPKVLVELANVDRQTSSLPSLTVNPILEETARRKALDMAAQGYFAHTSPDGKSPWYWFGETGYRFSYAGENLAVNFTDSIDVERAWMNSPGHRANILNGNFTEIGIATARGTYQGRDTIFVVQMFGRPVQTVAFVSQVPPASKPAPSPPQLSKESLEGKPPRPAIPPSPVTTQTVAAAHLETIEENNMFVAVKNTEVANTEPESKIPAPGLLPSQLSKESLEGKATLLEKLFTSPRHITYAIYIILGGLIFFSLMLTLFLEIEKRHPRHIAYAALLLLLLAGSVYFANTLTLSRLLVI